MTDHDATESSQQSSESSFSEELFRQEALAHHVRGHRDQGEVLHLSPKWIPWVFRLLIAVFAVLVLLLIFAPVDEYSGGPFIVRMDDRVEVSAPVAGTVAAIEVETGDRAVAGQLLARFHSAQEAAQLDRIRQDLELALIRRLQAPFDSSTEQPLSSLRAQRKLAEAHLEARSLRSPQDGVISDIRAYAGQHVAAGQAIASISGERAALSVIAALPGHVRPLVGRDMSLRLELEGYRHAYQHLTIDRIGNEVLAADEARRFLGGGDTLSISGPVIFVHAHLSSNTFESDGRRYRFHDGMRGLAEIRIRKEGLFATLFPAINFSLAELL